MNGRLFFFRLESGSAVSTDSFNLDGERPKIIHINGNSIFYSRVNTYVADCQKTKDSQPVFTKLSSGELASPVLDDGETLFFVVNSDLSRRKTLIGYDKKLQQPVLSREVTGAFDLHMTADKSIQLADPSGLYTDCAPPKNPASASKQKTIAPLIEAGVSEKFSPMKP